ncbi:hypothetical protein N7508_010377 [Penicillium antarcticum]|nr:uncharacterized protein N7508_010377 [Penicillium antarcticum]KAJ5295556.1 hypothetical protein N7508_010377 [Penicillium antarcticum]
MGARSTTQNILCRQDFRSASASATEEDDPFCNGDPCDVDVDLELCMEEQLDMDGDDDNEERDVSTRDLDFFEKRAASKSY